MSSEKIMGCDCSSFSVACVMLEGDKIMPVQVFGGKENDYDTRVEVIYKEFSKVLEEYHPASVYIEGAIYLKNIKTTLMIARIIDMVIAACIDKNIYYQTVDNKSWKKDILSNGNATKEQIMAFAIKKWGNIFGGNQDLADSSLIAFYGLRRMSN